MCLFIVFETCTETDFSGGTESPNPLLNGEKRLTVLFVFEFQMADPGRYLQCVRTLRDYAGKGCWEAQVCYWPITLMQELISDVLLHLVLLQLSLSVCTVVHCNNTKEKWRVCLTAFHLSCFPILHLSGVWSCSYSSSICKCQEVLTVVDILKAQAAPLSHKYESSESQAL